MATFPLLSSGAEQMLPYTEIEEFNTTQSEMECGKVFTWSENSNSMRGFIVEYSALTLAEVTTLEAFFVSMAGEVGSFTFTNDAGEHIDGCRFDQKQLSIHCLGPNEYAVTVKIAAPKF